MHDRRGWLALFISLLIAIGAYWIWFFRWEVYTWGDWGFVFTETGREFLKLPQVWASSVLGGIDISLPWYPVLRLAIGLLSHGVASVKAFHIIYLLPSVFVCSISSFLLTRYIHKSNLAGLIGSFVFTFNTYFLIIRGGHLPLVNAFALAPLGILAFLHGLKTSRVYYFVLAGFIASLSAAYEVRGAYLLVLLLAGLTVFFSPVVSRLTLVKSTAALFTLLVLNLYWVVSLFLAGGAASLSIFHRGLYGEGYAHLVRSSVLQLYQWGPDGLIGPSIQPTPIYLWIIPLLVFLELYLSRKNRVMVFFGLVSLAGVFFSKMSGQPFPGVYEWMFNNFPGFSVFREPSKFFFLSSLGYAVLLSGLVHRVWSKFHRTSVQRAFRVLFFCSVSGLFLINARGLVTGQLGELLKPRTIPADYLILKDFILSQPGFFRTFYLPYTSRWGIWTDSKPIISGLSLVQSDWYHLNGYRETGLDYSYFEEVANIFTKDFTGKLFNMSSIKYLVVPVQDTANNDDLFAIYGPRDRYLNLAKGIPFFQRVNIGTRQLEIYENHEYLPRFYATIRPDTVYEASISAQVLEYTRQSAAEYRVQIGPVTEDIYLNFTDLYHPGWKISPQPVSWFNIVLGRQQFYPDSVHLQNTAGLNTFLIPTSPDTSIPRTFAVYFKPQAYLNLGLVFSSVGAAAVLVYLCLVPIRHKKWLKK